jgi:DNA repair photolyase
VLQNNSLPILSTEQRNQLLPELRDPIEYRKSGLSLNHIVGCPLDCAYCVRHIFSNFEMKAPRALMSDESAVDALLVHRYFQRHVTPLQLFNRATDPLLPTVKPHTFRVLQLLDRNGLTNHVLVITRWRVSEQDCEVLNSLVVRFRNNAAA